MSPTRGHRIVGTAQAVGRDKWRFAAPAHHDFSTFPDGGPALEASWSHPTLKKAMALSASLSLERLLNNPMRVTTLPPVLGRLRGADWKWSVIGEIRSPPFVRWISAFARLFEQSPPPDRRRFLMVSTAFFDTCHTRKGRSWA